MIIFMLDQRNSYHEVEVEDGIKPWYHVQLILPDVILTYNSNFVTEAIVFSISWSIQKVVQFSKSNPTNVDRELE